MPLDMRSLTLFSLHKFQNSACALLVRGCCNWDRSCACIESSKHLGVPPIFRGCWLLSLCRKLTQARSSGVPALLESTLYWRRVEHEVAYDHPVAPRKVVESGEKRDRFLGVFGSGASSVTPASSFHLPLWSYQRRRWPALSPDRQKGSHCRGVVRALGDYYFRLQSAARFTRNFRPLLPQVSKHKSSPPSSYHKKQFNTRMPTMNMTKCSSGNAHAAEVKAVLFNAALDRCAVWWKQLHMRD